MKGYLFPPLIFPLFLLFIFLPFFLLIFIIGASEALSIVFEMPREEALLLFMMIAIGSLINIPITEREGRIVERRYYSFFGIVYRRIEKEKIVIAVNVGGCLIPTILSLKLLFSLPMEAFLLSFLLTTLVTFVSAKPVPNVGIVVPMFIPPLVAAFSAFISAEIFRLNPLLIPKLAFSSGVLGSLFGADILHLKDVKKVGAGIVSIGGAGTFDGIFLTGIFSVIFAVYLL
uniref:DUF1614 domain-containing protein n=1 Tax=Geoglobus ahangari TaxID=113653 RepID=A0A7J3TGU4_9EURY